jgi:hypothetical protein
MDFKQKSEMEMRGGSRTDGPALTTAVFHGVSDDTITCVRLSVLQQE